MYSEICVRRMYMRIIILEARVTLYRIVFFFFFELVQFSNTYLQCIQYYVTSFDAFNR